MKPTVKALKTDVHGLCLPDGRMVGSIGHDTARAYVVSRLQELDRDPFLGTSFCVPYRRNGQEFHNLVGVVRGENASLPPLLVGAHYDSVIAAPSADDNAAAVAIALAAARLLQRRKLKRDVVFAMFDAEEPPHFQTESMGSIRFFEDQMNSERIHAAIIMDLVGHDVVVPHAYLAGIPFVNKLAKFVPRFRSEDVALPIIKDLLFVTGAESHGNLAAILDDAKPSRGLRPVATLNRYIGDMSDHGVFRQNGVSYLFLSCGRWPHYHAPTDTPERLNYRKMQRISRYLVRIVEGLCSSALAEAPPVDTVDFEIRTLQRDFGPLLPPLLKKLGIRRLRSRHDLNVLVESLLGLGL